MKKPTKLSALSHHLSGLPLFDWRCGVTRSAKTRAAEYIMRRFGVTPDTANVIANLAGLGARADR